MGEKIGGGAKWGKSEKIFVGDYNGPEGGMGEADLEE